MNAVTEYRLIPLTRGQYALVDLADYEWLKSFSWCAHWDSTTRSFYAKRALRGPDGKQRWQMMHRAILDLKPGDHRRGDHQNHDTLDNRRENLRIVNHSQSSINRRRFDNNTSGTVGVMYSKSRDRWYARIVIDGKRKVLGHRRMKKDAIALRKEAERQYYGEFACKGLQ